MTNLITKGEREVSQDDVPLLCSTQDCGQSAFKFCTGGCQLICQQCYTDHQSIAITKYHHLITVTEGEALVKSMNPPYPRCGRHNYQFMDMYCRTCNKPVCSTCSQAFHREHDCLDIEEEAQTCKTNLQQIYENTEGLIHHVKQAIDKTKYELQEAETDINNMSENVKSTFKIIHEYFDKEEQKLMADLQEARKQVNKITNIIVDSQLKTLTSLENLKCRQINLLERNRVYDFATLTDSIQRDTENQHSKPLPRLLWSSNVVKKKEYATSSISGRVDVIQSEERNTNKQVHLQEVNRIRLKNQMLCVVGIAVYKQHIYTVHHKGFVVYCYTQDGELHSTYKHECKAKTAVQGMCIIKYRNTAMLVVSDWTDNAVVWISISDDATMEHFYTQQLYFKPRGICSDKDVVMICDYNHRIHLYMCGDNQSSSVIELPDQVTPWCIAHYGESGKYLVTDRRNKQVLIIDRGDM